MKGKHYQHLTKTIDNMTTTNWNLETKPGSFGSGWEAGQPLLTAGAQTDPITGLQVYAGYLGTGDTWTNESK